MDSGAVVVLVVAGIGLAAGLSWLIVGVAVAHSRRHPGGTDRERPPAGDR